MSKIIDNLTSGWAFYIFLAAVVLVGLYLLISLAEKAKGCCKKKKKASVGVSEPEVAYTSDCSHPTETLQLNLCNLPDMSPDDKKLRDKVRGILRKKDSVVIDNSGTVQGVIPLEALVLLTRSMNPIVNEAGEIIVKTKRKSLSEDLSAVQFFLESSEEPLSKKDQELLSNIGSLLQNDFKSSIVPNPKDKKVARSPKVETVSIEDLLESDASKAKEAKSEARAHKTRGDAPVKKEKAEEVKEAPVENNEITLPSVDVPEGFEPDNNVDESSFDLDAGIMAELGGFDDDFPSVEPEKKIDAEVKVSDKPLGDILLEDAHKKGNKKKSKSLPISLQKSSALNLKDPSGIKDELEKLIESSADKESLLFNLSLTNPIVYTQNKAAIFIPREAIFAATLSLLGNKGAKMLSSASTMTTKSKTTFINAISDILAEEVSDIYGKAGFTTVQIKKGADVFKAGGLFLTMESFKGALGDNYDNFRSNPKSKEYVLLQQHEELEDVPAFLSLEIKETLIF